VTVVADMCRLHEVPVIFIARPEVFTNSASLVWLQQQLGGIKNHLCITDGMAVRIIPEMHNHMFAYRLGIQENADTFARLLRRVPEFISTLASQVNTAFSLTQNGKRLRPATCILPASNHERPGQPELYPFLLHPHDALSAAKRSLSAGAIEAAPFWNLKQVIYIPLTETAARDAIFAEEVGTILTRAYFDPTLGVILRMPFLVDSAASVVERIAVGLTGLCAARSNIPRVLTEKIAWCTDDLDSTIFQSNQAKINGILPGSFDFWRHPPSFYAACTSVAVHMPAHRRLDRAHIRPLLQKLIRDDVGIHWLQSVELRHF
jgi:hypothetical protein